MGTDDRVAKILRVRNRENAICWFAAALGSYVHGQPGEAQQRLQCSYTEGMAGLHRPGRYPMMYQGVEPDEDHLAENA